MAQSSGANRITVKNCTIADIGTIDFPEPDSHAVGIQGGDGHIIQNNRTERTGQAIVLFTGPQSMKNNTISGNVVKDVYVKSNTGGGGLAIGGDGTTVIGTATGNRIFGNVIINTGIGATETWQGAAIASNLGDYIYIANNTLVNVTSGIYLTRASEPVQCLVENNTIINPTNYYFLSVGSGTASGTNWVVDYNLFYPAVNTTTKFSVSPAQTHDTHSVLADPLFVGSGDYHLTSGSPARDAGTNVGLTLDFDGRAIPFGAAPDIGAYEYGYTSIILRVSP